MPTSPTPLLRLVRRALAPAAAAVLLVPSAPAAAAPGPAPAPRCGAVLTADTTLGADLHCPAGDGLVLAGEGLVLDLAGHTVRGGGTGTGLRVAAEGVRVRDGRVTGWEEAVQVGVDGEPGFPADLAGLTVEGVRLERSGVGLDVRPLGDATARRVTASGNGAGLRLGADGALHVYSSALVGNSVGAVAVVTSRLGAPLGLMHTVVRGNGVGVSCAGGVVVVDRSVVAGNVTGASFEDCEGAALRRSAFAANDSHVLVRGGPVVSACTTYLGGPAPTGVRRVPCGSAEGTP
ncbi:hypothetical protein NUM3379_05430 [Kineococcus sp. NUM-3379]